MYEFDKGFLSFFLFMYCVELFCTRDDDGKTVLQLALQSPEHFCTVFIVGQQIELQGKTFARHGQIENLGLIHTYVMGKIHQL